MSVFGKAAAKAVKKGTMARNRAAREIISNRAAQGQGLFSASSGTRRAWKRGVNGGTVRQSEEDMIQAARTLEKQQSGITNALRKNNMELRKTGKDAISGLDRKQIELENKHLLSDLNHVKGAYKTQMGHINSGTPQMRDMTTTERFGSAGRAVAGYMWGGSMRQTLARNGAVVGGIVGLNVGLDALENTASNRGSGSGGMGM